MGSVDLALSDTAEIDLLHAKRTHLGIPFASELLMMLISLFFAVRHTKGRTSAQSRQVGSSHVWNDIKVIRGEVLLLSRRQEGTKIPLMEEILHLYKTL